MIVKNMYKRNAIAINLDSRQQYEYCILNLDKSIMNPQRTFVTYFLFELLLCKVKLFYVTSIKSQCGRSAKCHQKVITTTKISVC